MLSRVLENQPIGKRLFVLTVSWAGAVQAGQFFMINTPSKAQILPRPISVFDYDPEEESLSFLIAIRGEGTKLLSQLKVGDNINLNGPLGKGFPTDIKGAHILLISGAEGIAPMLLAAKNLLAQNTLRLYAGFRTKEDAQVLKYFSAYQDEMEIAYTTEEEGGVLVTSLLEQASPAHAVYLCGSMPMMKACVKAVSSWKKTRKFVSLESHMACGVGACMGCTVKGKKGQPLRPCNEGPVFEAKEVF